MMPDTPFRNEPFTDFTDSASRQKQEQAIAEARKHLGKSYPMLIGGKEITTDRTMKSVNPARTSEVIAEFPLGTAEHAVQALENGWKTFETWSQTSAEERAAIGFKAAEIMRRRKFEVNAWMILESGKSFAEADGDTAEAIDFLDWYARQMLRIAAEKGVTPVPGEENQLRMIPLGCGAIIPPWNFPMAIPTGMAAGAWITGNTCVLKPAEDTPMMSWLQMEILKEAGLPDGVVNFVTGPGEVVGAALVEHPRTRFVSFTGSREVGLGIVEKAARTQPGQIFIKRVVAEMGGKDAIIVDRETDIDAAAKGVLASAFGFQGQKCSACSRAIVEAAVYDEFMEKLVAHGRGITQGDPAEAGNFMGPMINQEAFDKSMRYIGIGKEEGELVLGGEGDDSEGWFVRPTIIKDVDPQARLAQEEVFGPVLAVIKAKDWHEAMEIANNTQYGLTGAVYTDNKDKIADAMNRFHVGNLYINRKCTGALVGAHPFGGFNMSGTDSKAGGKDYLLYFLQGKLISAAE